MYEILLAIKAHLETIPDITTCKIGLEENLTPADYPIIRIVASSNDDAGFLKEKSTVKIYYGFDLTEIDGLEFIYEKLYSLESQIKELISPDLDSKWLCKWKSTIADEDRLDGYKVLCSVFEVEG